MLAESPTKVGNIGTPGAHKRKVLLKGKEKKTNMNKKQT